MCPVILVRSYQMVVDYIVRYQCLGVKGSSMFWAEVLQGLDQSFFTTRLTACILLRRGRP